MALGAILGAVAPALISAGSDYLTNQQSMNYASFASKSAFSRAKWMASNKHQMEVEDLRKAGLNPILSATAGGGSAPSVPIAPVPSLKSPGASAVQSMLEYKQAKSVIELNKKLADKAVSDSDLSRSLSEKAKADKIVAETDASLNNATRLATEQTTEYTRFRFDHIEKRQIEDAVKYHVYNLSPSVRGTAAHAAHVGENSGERGMNIIQLVTAKITDMLKRREIEARKKENEAKRKIKENNKNSSRQGNTVNINIGAVVAETLREHPELLQIK